MKLRVSLFAFVFLVAAAPAFASPSGVVISAFDTRGTNGASDEFVEIHNTSASSVSVAGWKLQGCQNGTPGTASDRATVPAGVTLSPGQYYLFYNSTATTGYSGPTPGDLGYTTGFSDFTATSYAGIRLLDASATVQDGVGSQPNSPCKEGTGLTTPTTNGSSNIFVRTQDTDNNVADFAGPQSYTPHNFPTSGGTQISIDNPSVLEGNTGSTATLTFTVHLSAISASAVTFDIATADGTATSASGDYVAQTLTNQSIAAGQQDYTFNVTVNGDNTPENDETVLVNVTNVSGATPSSVSGTGTILNDDGAIITRIHDVQGNVAGTIAGNVSTGNGCAPTNGADDVSPLCGQTITVEAIVTSNLLGSDRLKGFFLQETDANADADPNTSEGIFVFCGTCANTAVAEGQRVRVTGTVQEFFGMTEISATAANVVVTDAANHLAEVTPVHVMLPIAGNVNSFYESVEGMLVQYDTLVVSEYFQLYRYGQVVLVGGLANDTYMNTVGDGRPRTFTEDHTPDTTGYANHLAELARSQVILDDDRDGDEAQLLEPAQHQYVYWPQANGGFSLGTQGQDYFRGGDQVQNLVGVVQWARPGSAGNPANTWRIRPSTSYPVAFTPVNARPATPPDVGGAIRAVGMNLLNYFTTLDTTATGCAPDHSMECRGANSSTELDRQTQRAAGVICTLNPDVAAFMELENNNVPAANYTISHLLSAVNARCGGAHPYDFVAVTDNPAAGTLGTDAIRVMQVYRTGVLALHGAPQYDSDPIHNRPPTAQAYDVVDSTNPAYGQRFIVVANHLKSKGSCPGSGADADQLDGQGCWASTRTQQASRTMDWISGTVIPGAGTGNVLLLGDFNSYAHETPVTTLEAGGYHDMETELHGLNGYSYLFSGELGHLDYAFANEALKNEITGADAWHINADESDLFDYNDTVQDPREATFNAKPDGTGLTPPRVFWDTSWNDNTVGLFRASDHDPVVVGLFDPAAKGQLTITPTSLDFNDQVVGSSSSALIVTLGNTGVASLKVTALDAAAPPFARVASGAADCGSTPITIAVGGSCTLSYTFAPTATGPANQTLALTANDLSGGGNIALAGNGVQGSLTITPPSINFGNQAVGTTSAEHTVTLGNSGTASLDVTALTAASGAFARTATGSCGATPITIAAGDSCTLTYTFAPTSTGAANQTLTVTANAPGSGTIALSGNGVQGNLTIVPTSIAFGNQVVGTTSNQHIVTLGNNGTASLDVTLDAAVTPFVRAGGTCAASGPITLTVGASCTLTYEFAPTATGGASQTLTATSSGTGSGSIDLLGTGVPPQQADISVIIGDGAEYARVGDTITYTIVVRNSSGPIAAQATVSDMLPANLDNGAWTCVVSGGATCGAGATSNTLSDIASLPVGGSVTYTYTASVIAEDGGYVVNTAAATVNGSVTDPNSANNSATDTDTLVIFRDGFEGQ